MSDLSRFFSSLHQWISEPHLIPATNLDRQAARLGLSLQRPGLLTDTAESGKQDRKRRLRTEHWQPAARLLENLLRAIRNPDFFRDIPGSERETVSEVLREVREKLNDL
ncbi:MAG: hypothetical protein BECKG1743D_GA0114223_110761 [Candidatus Kentron sp. G]|nr:MAG: hypothetical protein BECKG1743D_GA0114223_110761 [Candidatus Kentron sp. G]